MKALLRLDSKFLCILLSCLLVASVAMAQESAGSSGSASAESLSPTSPASPVVTGQKAPVPGTFRPAPQADPTRIVALVPMVDVPGVTLEGGGSPKAALFLHDLEGPGKSASARTKTDESKAEVPRGIVAFRAMYSDDGQWALVDLQAREASVLDPVRKSQDTRVRIFTATELASPSSAREIALPPKLNLAEFLDQ
jgi:hypothetical protein